MLYCWAEYWSSGFLHFQRAIDTSIIQYHSPTADLTDENLNITLQRHPYPEWLDDPFVIILQGQFPFYIMLTFLCTAPIIVKDVVLEKERKLKVFLKHFESTSASSY